MALTSKKRLFADAVLAGKSNKEAAVVAGYSVKTASAAGARLAKDKDVVLYLVAARVYGESKAPKGDGSRTAHKPGVAFDLAALTNFRDPKAFLMAAMNDGAMEDRLRLDAAKALLPYTHQRKGEGGKKDAQQEAAKKAASKFGAPPPAPRLAASGGKKL